MARAKSGGGATLNKRKEVPVRTGKPQTNKILPAGASQLGQQKGDHSTERRKPSPNPLVQLRDGSAAQVDSGNRRAVECKPGPGGGREIFRSGYQSLHGKPVQGEPASAVRRDILREFGRESPASLRRRGA
jgi:hypothetical protein